MCAGLCYTPVAIFCTSMREEDSLNRGFGWLTRQKELLLNADYYPFIIGK